MNMSAKDWDNMIHQHKQSVDQLVNGNRLVNDKRSAKPQPVSSSGPLGSKEVPYLFIVKATQKAKFYATKDDQQVQGFWVPKSIIVREEKEAVHVKEWFRINIVKMR